jgi:hypothetical protein
LARIGQRAHGGSVSAVADYLLSGHRASRGLARSAALATVVGVLVEVPVMLSVVHMTMRSKVWYERAL